MMPIVLHSSSRQASDVYIMEFVRTHNISPYFITRMEPAGKEFSIKQIRELIKDTVYARSELQLYVLYAFDTASAEAQNALLKTLEEHKASDRYILEAAQPHRLLPTILSRSQVVQLDQKTVKNTNTATELDQVLHADTPPLNHPFFQVQKYEKPLEIFDRLIAYLQCRLPQDPVAAGILKEAIISRNRVRENNLNTQYALDRILILIYKKSRAP